MIPVRVNLPVKILIRIIFDDQIFCVLNRTISGLRNYKRDRYFLLKNITYLSIIELSFFIHRSSLHFLNLIRNGAQLSLENMQSSLDLLQCNIAGIQIIIQI
mgnify:CR=1 FL=1